MHSTSRESTRLDSIRPIGDDVGMTVVDEHSRVPPLDAAALDRLAHALDREGVVAAMLIGSQARGNAGPLSDIDVAVWHEPNLGPSQRLSLQLGLASAAGSALGTNEIDIVMLNRAPPLLRQRAIRDAVRLVERNPDERVRLETRAILDYLDTAPLRAELGQGLRRRIREGRFGRR
jgi:predicted nucleotidyltransferase